MVVTDSECWLKVNCSYCVYISVSLGAADGLGDTVPPLMALSSYLQVSFTDSHIFQAMQQTQP